MGCLGLHLALTPSEVQTLRSTLDDHRADFVYELEEQLYDTEHCYPTDKAWDAIHRCLGDGTLSHKGGSAPLNLTILGGEILDPDETFIIRLVTPAQAAEVGGALAPLTKPWLHSRYFRDEPSGCDWRSDTDFEYTWEYLRGLAPYFNRAAAANRFVVFSADQ
jgi:hypothetical protein